MKTVKTTLVILLVAFSLFQSRAQVSKIGAIAEFNSAKQAAENTMALVLGSGETYATKQNIVKAYNNVLRDYNAVIAQLQADNSKKLNIKLLKKLDKALKENTLSAASSTDAEVANYITALKNCNISLAAFQAAIPNPLTMPAAAAPAPVGIMAVSPTDALDVAKSVYDFINPIIEAIIKAKKEKVEAINKSLEQLKLQPVQDIKPIKF